MWKEGDTSVFVLENNTRAWVLREFKIIEYNGRARDKL